MIAGWLFLNTEVGSGVGGDADINEADLDNYVIRAPLDELGTTLAIANIVAQGKVNEFEIHTLVWWGNDVIILNESTSVIEVHQSCLTERPA